MSSARPSNEPTGKRLESWKEIAAHLDKGVRTVIRWEKTEGLPVHRHQHERKSSVFAFTAGIDEWLRTRHPEIMGEARPRPAWWVGFRGLAVAGLVLILAAAGIVSWRDATRKPLILPLKSEPLTSYPGGQYAPTFSPDASHFAFVWTGIDNKNVDLYLQAIGSAEPKRLTDHPDLDFSPAWSPDGRWIAFLRRSQQMKLSLHLMAALGGGERRLADLSTRYYMNGTQITWTADSRRVIFGDGDKDGPGLFLLSVEDLQRRRLTKSERVRGEIDPSLSPDGRHLAFRCDNNDFLSEICLLPLTTKFEPAGKPERLTHLSALSTSPVWTQDGDHLVFSSGTVGAGASLYRLRVFPPTRREN
jgi:Tol biopolymer transport system component